MLHFLVRHRPTLVGIFISCCPCSLFAGDCGKAWREKIPERSEDDFFPANQPAGPPCAISPANGYLYGRK
ncbi:hypothetical protein [Bacteroides eggerthii]|uniref:hypothetical protein n=1 Tax=Bacteroides eggerthii TaxID=28111 RepID=UPI003561B17D